MIQYLQPVVDYLHQNPKVGTLAAFLIALTESLPLLGTIIPGSVTMTAIGTLIGTGLLPGYQTLIWASFGAFVGDTIGFSIGYLFTESVRNLWVFKKYPHWLKLSECFFEKHGGKSIIIGRFVGPARSTVPLVAGLLKLSWLRFLLAAIPSAILWAILYMTPGILLGALALELPPHIATEFLFIGLGIIIGLWLIFWILQYFFSQFARLINIMIDKLWDTCIQHKTSRAFIRLIAVERKPQDHYQLTLTLLAVLSALLFILIFYAVTQHTGFTVINQPLFSLFQSIRTKPLDNVFILVTELGFSISMMSIGLLISLGLAAVRQWRAAIHILAIDLIMLGATAFFKYLSHNPRPTGFNYVSPQSSFPSGHTSMSFVILNILAYFSGKLVKPSLKWIPYTVAILLTLLIALSRLYLGTHWLTDILGSITLGFAVLFLVIMNYRRRAGNKFKTINKPYWWILITCSILLPWLVRTYKNFNDALYRYTPLWPTITLNEQEWWENPTALLPLYLLNRFHKPIQPFNLQWSTSLPQIKSHLRNAGWTVIDLKYSVKGTLKRFADKHQNYHLPLLPWLHRHKPPRLVVIKKIKHQNSFIELRLWDSGVHFTNINQPLWIGTINYHLPTPKKITFTNGKIRSLQASASIATLIPSLEQEPDYQYKIIHIPHHLQPKKVQALDWNGYVIIIRNKPSQ